MVDYLLIGILFFVVLASGVFNIVWSHRMRPRRMKWFGVTRLSAKEEDAFTRVEGVIITVVALIFAFFFVKNSL